MIARARFVALIAIVAGCASVPAPEPPVTDTAPQKTAVPIVPRPWIELTGTDKATELIGHDAKGEKTYSLTLANVRAAAVALDGGAYVLTPGSKEQEPGKPYVLVAYDVKGEQKWRHPIDKGNYRWHIAPTEDRVLLFDLVLDQLFVLDAKSGEEVKTEKLQKGTGVADRNGVVVAAHLRGVSRLGPDGQASWSKTLGSFPSTDGSRDLFADTSDYGGPSFGREVAVGFDGTILVGGSDGSIIAFDPDGTPRFQLGVRGAVSSIAAHKNGDFAIKSDGGVTLVAPDGTVRKENEKVGPGPLADAGVVDKRTKTASGEPAEASDSAPAWPPTVAYGAHRGRVGTKPIRDVASLVAISPTDVWALASEGKPADFDKILRLYHYDGTAWSDRGVPTIKFTKEAYSFGHPAAEGQFIATGLGKGPKGALLVIGDRVSRSGRRKVVLQKTDQGYRERRELRDALSRVELPQGNPDATYASSENGREVLCIGQEAQCFLFGQDQTARPLLDDEGKTLEGGAGRMPGTRGAAITPVLFAGDELWFASGHATRDGRIYGVQSSSVEIFDGAATKEVETPMTFLQTAWASGPTDVWLTGLQGVAHYDGERFSRILEIPYDVDSPWSADLSVTGTDASNVWVYGRQGVWHVKPEAGSEPPLQGAVAPPPPASPASTPLALGDVDPSYRLEPLVLDVPGSPPLRGAMSVARAPGGAIWFHDGSRLVEYDGSKARLLYAPPTPEPFVCWSAPEPDCMACADCTERRPLLLDCERCAAPVAAGEGALIGEDGLLTLSGGRAVGSAVSLSSLTAVGATPSGAVWVVSSRVEDDLPRAILHTAKGRRIVEGLPSAAYVDVNARAEDDVWLAGGLVSLPGRSRVWAEGEGTVVHFDGRTFTRHRGPDGALLGVSGSGTKESWAAGLRGGIVNVKAGKATAYHLPARVALRSVAATSSEDVFIAGDDSTLIHWDGKLWRRIDTKVIGTGAGLAAVVAPGKDAGYVVGPRGIWKIVRTP